MTKGREEWSGMERRHLRLLIRHSSFVIRHCSCLFLAPPIHGPILSLVKILFIGDIVGEPGRRAVKTLVPLLRIQHRLDVVVANGENAAVGSGITTKIA